MGKQPYIPFYIGDYLKDTRVLPLAVRGFWVDIILFMWDAPDRGELIGTIDEISRMVGCSKSESEFALNLLKAKKTADIDILPNGEWRIVSRRMKFDSQLSKTRADIGSKGGKKNRYTKTKKLYNEPGYLYIMADDDTPNEFKIGISNNPEKRIYGVRRTTGRQRLRIVWTLKVGDMGEIEDFVLRELEQHLDGEWGAFESEAEAIRLVSFASSKFKSKTQANSEYEYEYENDTVFKIKKGVKIFGDDETQPSVVIPPKYAGELPIRVYGTIGVRMYLESNSSTTHHSDDYIAKFLEARNGSFFDDGISHFVNALNKFKVETPKLVDLKDL